MSESLSLQFPDWKSWLHEHAGHAARDAYDYQLHLAATEWALSSALDINQKGDFVSLPLPNVDPFSHQVEDAILFFRRLQPRGLIADDVGLGKTITAGLIARELLERGRIESILVVCPKSLVEQWREELETKFGINATVGIGTAFSSLDASPYWITSYHTARSRMTSIRSRKFDLLILDEAHALRNLYGTQKAPQVAKAFANLMRDDVVRYCIMLTATPIQNRLWDIFSLLEILKSPQPNPFGTPDRFRTRFIADPPAARTLVAGTRDDFRRHVSEATVRTRRRDANLLFPDREVKDQLLMPLQEESDFLDRALEVLLHFPPLVQITHARTMMSSPWAAAIAFERAAERSNVPYQLRYELLQLARLGREVKESAKVRAVVKLVEGSSNDGRSGRIIVFTQRVETLRHLSDALQNAGFGDQVGIIQGGEALANRRAIRDFMAEPPLRPILLSTDTGAVGLNLQAGNIVVNYDLPWNPMVVEQRIGRVQRLGQKASKVIVYNLVLSGTIEERVVLRLMEKLNLFNQAIGEMEELLELCGYDDERRSLDQVIMELIRKAAEQKDIAEDMRRMEESRAGAERKMREMREANEKALESIRPKDVKARLDGLEKPNPRLPLVDLITACLKRTGADYREEDGRLFVRVSPMKYVEFMFERQANGALQDESFRVIIPGTTAFERITKIVREQIAHHILDASGFSLDKVRTSLEAILGTRGMVIDSLKVVETQPAAAVRIAARVAAEIPSDRYEALMEAQHATPQDEVDTLMESWENIRDNDGAQLPKATGSGVQDLAILAPQIEATLRAQIIKDESIDRFCRFYAERYQEDLDRLAEHAREMALSQGLGSMRSLSSEAVLGMVAKREPAIRTAISSLQFRWTPMIKVQPLGVNGIVYSRAEINVYIRNREQAEAFAVPILAIPLTGIILRQLTGIENVTEGSEGWCCPGGHLVAAADFIRCSAEGCTLGACKECAGRDRPGIPPMSVCSECEVPLCNEHRFLCAGCGEALCKAHAAILSGRNAHACPRCSVELEDGRKVLDSEILVSAASGRRGLANEMLSSPISGRPFFPGESATCEESERKVMPDELVTCEITGKKVATDITEISAVSGRCGSRSQMKRSSWSGRPCLPGEEQLCDETGVLLLPDEIGQCSQTGKRVDKQLLEDDAETGRPVLKRLIKRSDVSGQPALHHRLIKSDISDRYGMSSEIVKCEICGNHILMDEAIRCPETGQSGCRSHFFECEVSGVPTLDEGLSICEATSKRVRRSLLEVCPETGQSARREVFEICEASSTRVLPEGLGLCSVTGQRVRKSLLAACQVSGQQALPKSLESCSVSGKLVRPDLLITCPETGSQILPSSAVACEETGTLVSPSAIGTCAKTGRGIRHSLLSPDDVTGQLVLSRLLVGSAVSQKKALPENLLRSAVSHKLALREEMEQCGETEDWALPGELERCAQTGKQVLPNLLITCPETGMRLLCRAAERCEVTGVPVSPQALGQCEATGKRVRESLLGVDQVTGQIVQRTLLRECERTHRRTLRQNLVHSAVSGMTVLADLATKCEETRAPALYEELELCEVSGKRVLPSLLHRCKVSGCRALRRLMQRCDVTGKLVHPESLMHCSRSGKNLLASSAVASDISGERGHPEIIAECKISGRKAFPDELVVSEVSGTKIAKDRAFHCPACDRLADLSELRRCSLCHQGYCDNDYRVDTCASCGNLITHQAGRDLTLSEIALVKRKRPWVRNGRISESSGLAHLHISGGRMDFKRAPSLLVLKREKKSSLAEQIDRQIQERSLDRRTVKRIQKLWGAGLPAPPKTS